MMTVIGSRRTISCLVRLLGRSLSSPGDGETPTRLSGFRVSPRKSVATSVWQGDRRNRVRIVMTVARCLLGPLWSGGFCDRTKGVR
jgi:hypothetical protein